jgi:prolyl oligopeptidase
LFYTRYPRPGERPDEDLDLYQQVWFHRLGAPTSEDRYEYGRDLARVAEIRLQTDRRSERVLASVQYGDSGTFQHVVREVDGTWRAVTTYDDEVVEAWFAPDGSLILVSRKDAPRGRILRTNRTDLALASATVLVEEGTDANVSDFYGSPPIVVTPRRLYVTYQLGGPSTVRCFDHQGRPRPGPDFPPVSSVSQIVALAGDEILVRSQSYLQPPAWYHFTRRENRTERTALFEESPTDLSGVEVARQTAVSEDGTQVPVTILSLDAAKRDGPSFALLTGYGGFGISIEPRFDPMKAVWLEQGGIWAAANLRGGGEFGERWHRAGSLTEKQNVFDDFAAAMRHLIDRGYSTTDRLAIRGGSNGGLLMGAMITQHPDLARTVVSLVGIYDMLRFELSPNGRFNIPEYGTVEDPEQFRALHAYSPYHHVVDGTPYPAILFMTGANDPRVDPMQSRKMTARLQAASASDRPILLRTSGDTGHGGGTPLSARVAELTDAYAFLFHELGVDYRGGDADETDAP